MPYAVSRFAREYLKRLLVKASRRFCTPLNRQQTRSLPFLEPLSSADSQDITSLWINGAAVHLQRALHYPETFLFRARAAEGGGLTVLPSGGISAGDRLLDNGFRQDHNIYGYLQSRAMRKEPFTGTVVAPWPHRFLTYGDFVLQLLPELCLVRSLLADDEWGGARLVLPRAPSFVSAYLALLGFSPNQVVDATKHCFGLQPGSQVYFREKDPMWYLCAPPGLLRLARESLLPAVRTTGEDLLFVERQGGYRNAIGLGKEARARLEEVGMRLFDASTVSVQEQIEVFSNARLVVGVHGGGLANILWCRAGTAVIELFNPSYTPPCYAILANHLDLDYYCLGGMPGQLDIRFRESDVAVDWQGVMRLVSSLLTKSV